MGMGECHCKRLTFISLPIVINQKDYYFDYAIAWLSVKGEGGPNSSVARVKTRSI